MPIRPVSEKTSQWTAPANLSKTFRLMDILDELQWRGLVNDCTAADELAKRLAAGPVTLYCGFDPTADSLHLGNLVPLLALRRFQLCGHRPIALAGGATGSIGDPSGKKSERQLLTRETLDHNIEKVKGQLARLIDFSAELPNPATLVDNASWTAPITFLDFLREVGKFITVNSMVSKESVRARMEDKEAGISFTEFSYMLLQGYDFYHLNQTMGCELQIGGSDQWGNITVGTELTRKKAGATVFGLTLPLITNADGTKFGKTEAGAVWLDPGRTSVYRFYQYWIRTDDRDVVRYLNYFTFLSRDEIAALEAAHRERPERREAHAALARTVTSMVHGEGATQEAIRASEILFGGGLEGITEATFGEIVGEVPTRDVLRAEFDGEGVAWLELLVRSGLAPSKGQARKDIAAGGAYLNNVREADPNRGITAADLLFQRHLLIRKGKRNYVVVTAR